MISDTEVARRAAIWFAGVGHPAGTTLVLNQTPLIVHDIAIVFAASLQPKLDPLPAMGNGPVVVDRRNGALTPLGTGGSPQHLFEKYLASYGAAPPPALADPAPSANPTPPLQKAQRGRPSQPLRPRGQVPARPWPPVGRTAPGDGPPVADPRPPGQP